MRTDFPEVIDSTMRSAFVSCPHKFYNEFILQIAPQGVNRDLHAGGCFAAGICAARRSFYERGEDSDLAIAHGIVALIREWGTVEDFDDYVKSFDRVVFALIWYFEQYPMATDIIRPLAIGPSKCAIEVTFALQIPNTKHPTTGNPIMYAGRFDMIGVRQDVLFIVDEKTTKQLGPTWSGNWTLRSQFTGYVWGAHSYGHAVAGAIIRGISFLKGGNETQQAIVYRPEWQIARWLDQLQRDTDRMIQCWKNGYWDYDLDTACTQYGGCPFVRLCDNSNPDSLMDVYYQPRIWDPLHKGAE
jgi:hypothetical protein